MKGPIHLFRRGILSSPYIPGKKRAYIEDKEEAEFFTKKREKTDVFGKGLTWLTEHGTLWGKGEVYMAIGIVTEKELEEVLGRGLGLPEKEADGPTGTIPPVIVDMPSKGRGKGNLGVPPALRNAIASQSLTEGRQEALAFAQEFDVSSSSVSAYAHGANSTASYDEPSEVANFLNGKRKKIIKKAKNKMLLAMEGITEEALVGTKPRDLASIAKDMAGVIKTMEPQEESKHDGPPSQFHFYAPPLTQKHNYEVIDVRE